MTFGAPTDASNAIFRKRVGRDDRTHEAKQPKCSFDCARRSSLSLHRRPQNQTDSGLMWVSVCFTEAPKRGWLNCLRRANPTQVSCNKHVARRVGVPRANDLARFVSDAARTDHLSGGLVHAQVDNQSWDSIDGPHSPTVARRGRAAQPRNKGEFDPRFLSRLTPRSD